MKLVDMIKDKVVRFTHFTEGELWYVTEDGFEFPVPTNRHECGTANFLAEDKAILFMRYIRKHIEMLEKAKENAT